MGKKTNIIFFAIFIGECFYFSVRDLNDKNPVLNLP